MRENKEEKIFTKKEHIKELKKEAQSQLEIFFDYISSQKIIIEE